VLTECSFFLAKEDRACRINLDNDSFFSFFNLSSSSYWLSEIFTKGRTIDFCLSLVSLAEQFLGTEIGLILNSKRVWVNLPQLYGDRLAKGVFGYV